MGRVEGLESEHFIFAWDHFPATPGHALIIPKRHVQFMRDLNEHERAALIDCAVTLKQHILSENLVTVYETLLTKTETETERTFMNHAISRLHMFNRPPEAFNDGLNDGPAAGQTMPHFHWHVMPRWKDDVADVVGGVRHMFPGMGNYKNGSGPKSDT